MFPRKWNENYDQNRKIGRNYSKISQIFSTTLAIHLITPSVRFVMRWIVSSKCKVYLIHWIYRFLAHEKFENWVCYVYHTLHMCTHDLHIHISNVYGYLSQTRFVTMCMCTHECVHIKICTHRKSDTCIGAFWTVRENDRIFVIKIWITREHRIKTVEIFKNYKPSAR